MFGAAMFEASEVKGQSMLNFEVWLQPRKFVIVSESLAANPKRQGSLLYDKQFQSSDSFILLLKNLLLLVMQKEIYQSQICISKLCNDLCVAERG
jgi:hypothetical protein